MSIKPLSVAAAGQTVPALTARHSERCARRSPAPRLSKAIKTLNQGSRPTDRLQLDKKPTAWDVRSRHFHVWRGGHIQVHLTAWLHPQLARRHSAPPVRIAPHGPAIRHLPGYFHFVLGLFSVTVVFNLEYAYRRGYADTSWKWKYLTSRKTKHRNRLNLEAALILELTKIRPRTETLTCQKQAQSTH
jgi:hypothetical protein